GIIATIIYETSKQAIRDFVFKRRFKFLTQKNISWIGYCFKESNTNEIERKNGATANFKIVGDRLIEISVNHDDRQWSGQITLLTKNYGKLFFKYSDKEEFGTKDCYINKEDTGSDSILLIPTNNPILSTVDMVKYSYGKELFKKQ